MDPSAVRYAETHEWVAVDGDVATVGISDFAVRELNDVTYLELPAVGQQVKAGDSVGVIESVKAASDIYTPVSGEIVEVNQPVSENFDALADDPFGAGWLFRVRMSNPEEVDRLMDRAAYDEHCRRQQQ
ncbi:MAG: glycine cleavage system protein GcvH [Planctomycetota bacterium]|nr:MAG: glycine cleavage system protein GcvH [Planctomycetota bacterium]